MELKGHTTQSIYDELMQRFNNAPTVVYERGDKSLIRRLGFACKYADDDVAYTRIYVSISGRYIIPLPCTVAQMNHIGTTQKGKTIETLVHPVIRKRIDKIIIYRYRQIKGIITDRRVEIFDCTATNL